MGSLTLAAAGAGQGTTAGGSLVEEEVQTETLSPAPPQSSARSWASPSISLPPAHQTSTKVRIQLIAYLGALLSEDAWHTAAVLGPQQGRGGG